METDTNTRTTDPNLVDQLLSWAESVPPMPHFLDWAEFLFSLLILVLTLPAMIWWRRSGANWWAARSGSAARKRAMNLYDHVVGIHFLGTKLPVLISLTATALVHLMISMISLFAAAFIILLEAMGLLVNLIGALVDVIGALAGVESSPDERDPASITFVLWLVMGFALINYAYFSYLWSKRIGPFLALGSLTEQSRTKIERLLTRAGVDQDEIVAQLEAFDADVEMARKGELE